MYRTIVGLGSLALLLLSGCQEKPQAKAPEASVSEKPATAQPASAPAPPQSETLLKSLPLLESDSPAPPVIPATLPSDRLPTIQTGRSNPFAPLDILPDQIEVKPQTPASESANPTTATLPQPPTPVTATVPLPAPPAPTLPTSSQPASNSPPVIPVSGNPPEPPPAPLAETLEVRGIIQLGDQWQAIVKEPQERSSRVVQAGDVLGGGQVRVRRIEVSSNGIPTLVLEQNGIEIIRTVS